MPNPEGAKLPGDLRSGQLIRTGHGGQSFELPPQYYFASLHDHLNVAEG